MIFWLIYIPITAFLLIQYFYWIDKIFNGNKKAFRIEEENENIATRKEKTNTIINLFVFALFGFLTGWCIDQGIVKVYHEFTFNFISVLYLIVSFFIALAIHDLYFYITHRFLHSKFMFKYVHYEHHQSHHTNAWSAFSFHPVEGIIQIAIVPLVALIIPVHEYVLILFTFFLLFISVYGHCGYELRPNKWKGFEIFNTSLHHYQHHKYVKYNFGIYLNLWDKLFKSDYPYYESSFKDLKDKINKKISF